MQHKQLCRWGAAVAALALVAAGCSTNSGASDDPTSERSTLEVIAYDQLPASLVPFQEQTLGGLMEAINIPLFQMDDKNEVFSNLLDSWELSDDATTATLRMKEGLEWSDGTPMMSADIVMSMTQFLDPSISLWASRLAGVAGQSAYAAGEAETITGLAAPDDQTVVVTFEQPDAAWLEILGYLAKFIPILPSHVLGDVPHDQLLENDYFKTYPVSSGPYKLVEYVADSYIELERNSNWSLGEAGFERIFYKEVDADVRSAQLEAGEAQLIWAVDPNDADRLASMDGVEVQSVTGAAPNNWWLMASESILDPRVRQAMIYAVDRQGICDQVLQGYCTVPATNMRQVAPEWSIPTDGVTEYDYNPDRARELLEEAGWDEGTELKFYNLTPGGITDVAIEIAQDNMADVGINWQIVDTDVPTTFEAIETNGTTELQGFWGGGGNFTADPSQVQVYADCDAFYPNGSNLVHYCDPELDALWDAGRRTSDQDERAEIYHEAFQRLNANPMEIVLYVQDVVVAYDARLKGVKPQPSNGHFWNIGEWHWEE